MNMDSETSSYNFLTSPQILTNITSTGNLKKTFIYPNPANRIIYINSIFRNEAALT